MSDEPQLWPGPVLPYFDPARPNLGPDRPSLLRPDGSAFNVVIPALMLTPDPSGTITLWGFFPMDGQSSSPKFASFPDWTALSAAYTRWLACPERFAMEELGWHPRERVAQTVRDFKPTGAGAALKELSLDDLM